MLASGHSLYHTHFKKHQLKIDIWEMKTAEPKTKHLRILRKCWVCYILKIETHTVGFFFQGHKITCKEEDLAPLIFEKFKELIYLIFYYDGSTVLSYSHILIMVSSVYNDSAFFTNDECEAINGTPVNIQPFIEKAFCYKLARCPYDDHQ